MLLSSNTHRLSRFTIVNWMGSIIVSLMLILTMCQLYVHVFFTICYLIVFIIGLLLSNFFEVLVKPQAINLFWIMLLLICSVMGTLFIMPWTSLSLGDTAFYIMIVVLFLSLIFAFSLYLMGFYFLNHFSVINRPVGNFIFVSFLICLALWIQVYGSSSFMAIWIVFVLFCYVLISLSSSVLERIIACILFLILGFMLICFYVWHLFYVKTSESDLAKTSFDLGVQLNFENSKLMDSSLLDLSQDYSGNFPTYKNIFLNGRYYGHLVGDLDSVNYAEYTPYSIAYGLKEHPKVLVLKSAGGSTVYLAHQLISGDIDALEDSQEVINRIRDQESLYVGGIYHNPNTIFYHSFVQPYIATTDKTYDIITLSYHIIDAQSFFFLMEQEPVLTENSLSRYMNILNPQGFVFLSVKTLSPTFTEALIARLVTTFGRAIPHQEYLGKYFRIFRAQDSVNILFFKNAVASDKDALYEASLDKLHFINVLNDDSSLSHTILAALSQNKNNLSHIAYGAQSIRDGQTFWYAKMANDFHLWPQSFLNMNQMIKFLWAVMIFVFVVCFFTRMQFASTNLCKMGLNHLFSYFLLSGLALGFSVIYTYDMFLYLISNSFIVSGWALGATVMGLFFNFVLFNGVGKIYYKILLSCILQTTFIFCSVLGYHYLKNYSITLSLILKILIPMVITFILHSSAWSICCYPFLWVTHMKQRDTFILRTSLLSGILGGSCFGFYFLLFLDPWYILVMSAVILLICLILILLIDHRYKKSDFLYSQDRF